MQLEHYIIWHDHDNLAYNTVVTMMKRGLEFKHPKDTP